MSRIISVVNQKGGVGKTTTAINLGAYLAWLGKFVLLVDLDPQANATSSLGVSHGELEHGVYHSIIGEKTFRDIIQPTKHAGYKVAPATGDLAGARIELVNLENREHKLRDAMLEVRNDYDYIIIDCPPSLDMLTINGLVAADDLLIPVQAEYLALEGLSQLLQTIQLIKDNVKPDLSILGAVVTMYDKRNKLSDQVVAELRQHFPHKVFDTLVPRNVRLTEAPSYGQTILHYDNKSAGAQAYEALAREILRHEHAQPLVPFTI